MNDKKRFVEVCGSCGRACCWHGEFMCLNSSIAGTIKKTVSELDSADLEHEHHYSRETMSAVYGEEAPHGYKD